MSAMADVGGTAGGVVGGLIGGALGGFFGPVGALVGRYAGSAVGRLAGKALAGTLESWINNQDVAKDMDDADEKSKENAESKADTDTCNGPDCNPRCTELANKIDEQINGNRPSGAPGGTKGIRQRIVENICGASGPYDATDRLGDPNKWQRHYKQIEAQQQSVKRRWKEYKTLKCDERDDNKLDQEYIDKWTDPAINPTAEQWLGPNDPRCMSSNPFDQIFDLDKMRPTTSVDVVPVPENNTTDILS